MHDFITEVFLWCKSNEFWQTEVLGKDGVTKHTVTFGPVANGPYSHNYVCDCKGFQFRHTCKHIDEAKKKHCQWGHEAASGSPSPVPADRKCPDCGGELVGVKVAI